MPQWALEFTHYGYHSLRMNNILRPTVAHNAYRQSQALIENTEARHFVGAGEGMDSQNFLADLQALEMIDPDFKR